MFEITGGVEIPDGNYPATLAGVTEEQGQFGSFRKWEWLVDVNGEVLPLSSVTSMNTGPQSKAYGYLTALLGRAPKTGEKIEDPTGSRVVLTIGQKDKDGQKWPTVLAVGHYQEPQQTLPGVPR